jgi:hypothetical protein
MKCWEILAAQLAASQEGVSSIELVSLRELKYLQLSCLIFAHFVYKFPPL